MKFRGVVAVLCVVPSGLVLYIGITSCNFTPLDRNDQEKMTMNYVLYTLQTQAALSLILKMKELCQATYASTFNLLL